MPEFWGFWPPFWRSFWRFLGSKNLLFFRTQFFWLFQDLGDSRASKIGAFRGHRERFFGFRRISENDALAWVSARSGRFQGLPKAHIFSVFWINFEDFFVMGRISENDALARVSARSGRSRGFPKSHIFDAFWGTDFRWFFRTLFFRVLVIFSDFWAPSGLPLDLHWDKN